MISTIDWIRFWLLQCFFWSSGVVFSYPLEKRKNFKKKILCFVGLVVVYSLLFQFVFWNGTVQMEFAFRLFSGLVMVLFLYMGWDSDFSIAIYNAVWAIVLWQLLTEVWSAIEFLGASFFEEYPYMIILGMILLFVVNNVIVAKTIGKWMPIDRRVIGPRQLASAVLIFLIIEILAMSTELRHISNYSSEWKVLYISQLLLIVILYMQNELFKKSAMRQELEIMNLLWKNKQDQYELTKENIALINQKCHDLKHQIQALRKLDKEEFDKYLGEIEDSVRIYESVVKTGNDVFDTILTEKSLHCKERKIKVCCVADGSQMDFIETIDLYAILGNAMDNAIEAVEKFAESEKRQIDVMIYRQQNFLVMNFINPVAEPLIYEAGLPVSTKGDRKYHGFGLRSMKHFVKKYDGFLNVSEEDGCFSLKIMIPIP